MSLNYDSQMELIFTPALYEDARIAPLLQQLGIHLESRSNKILLFTDPTTVAALAAADEGIKQIFRNNGVGLVLYGWNQQGRTEFLRDKLLGLLATATGDTLRQGVFRLHMFVQDGMLAKLNPNPFAAALPAASPARPFDLNAALTAMLSPEQIQKPKAPDHLRASRPFGRRGL